MNDALFLIGWALFDFVWQGALLGLVCAALLAVLRHARPQTRYVLACGGLLLCLLLPVLNGLFAWQAAQSGSVSLTLTSRISSGLPAVSDWQEWVTGVQIWLQTGLQSSMQPHLPALVWLWIICVVMLAMRLVLGLSWLGGYATDARSSGHPVWQNRLDALAAQLGISRKVALRVVKDLDSPVTFGSLQPLVLVPLALLSGMPAPLLEALLAHELAHIRRHDFLLNLLQSVIETLLFYHPVVWWLSKRIRIERELIADDLAASVLGEPRRLALALSELEQIRSIQSDLALAANGGSLMLRIKRLVRPETKPLNWQAAVAVVGIALGSLSLCAQAFSGTPAASAGKIAPVLDLSTCKQPAYPPEAVKKGETGVTELAFLVSKQGRITQSKVIKSSGSAQLDQAALKQLGTCKVQVATMQGKPVESWLKLAYEWKLE